jgi:hypothetical protein
MQKVLLAIDGIRPRQSLFQYAVQLCERLKAELDILHVIHPKTYSMCFRKACEGASRARQYFESTMMAAAFAEAGEHATGEALLAEAQKNLDRLLPESERSQIHPRLNITSGNPCNEIVRYVSKHRGVVLAIYDTGQDQNRESNASRQRANLLQKIRQKLPIPLVVLRS